MYEVIFVEVFGYSNDFIIDLFMANFQLLWNTQKETSFLKSVFAGVRKSRLQGCSVREKGGCLCENWKLSFLPALIFDWCTFSRQVTARW